MSKDETGKMKFDNNDSMTIWQEAEFDAVQLPEDAPLSLVIKLLNDLQFLFTDDKRAKTWKQYVKTIRLKDDTK